MSLLKNYISEYTKTHQAFNNRRLKTIENFSDVIPLVENALGFQFWFHNKITDILNSNEDACKESKQIAISHKLYSKNMHYLYSAFELAYSGLCSPAYNILRTVHESIVMLYYLAMNPEESENVLEYMKNDGKVQRINFGHKKMVAALYCEDSKKSMKNVYSELCIRSHPNVFGMGSTEEYSLKQIKYCFNSIQIESFYSIASYAENYSKKPNLIKNILVDECMPFLESMRKTLVKKDGTMHTYFPDKEENIGRLMISPGSEYLRR